MLGLYGVTIDLQPILHETRAIIIVSVLEGLFLAGPYSKFAFVKKCRPVAAFL